MFGDRRLGFVLPTTFSMMLAVIGLVRAVIGDRCGTGDRAVFGVGRAVIDDFCVRQRCSAAVIGRPSR